VKKDMLQNPQKELRRIRQELTVSMEKTMPTKEFGAAIITAMVRLHVIEAEIRKTQNLEERRRLINEFDSKKDAIEKGIQLLKQSSSPGFSGDSEERLGGAMP
jgi:hypothetical protein